MIDILLATYNGESYLAQQINSILNQSFKDWRLVIHDDGSTDSTVDIIRSFSDKHPLKIVHVDDGIKLGGAKENFFHLMKFAIADYIMFCDQDDHWESNKVESTVREIRRIEGSDSDVPCLVFTNLLIVDESLIPVGKTFWDYERIVSERFTLASLLSRNFATGCTMCMNMSLLRVALTGDVRKIILHDWWVALIGFSLGKVSWIENGTIQYRLHAENHTGATDRSFASSLRGLIASPKRVRCNLERLRVLTLIQAEHLLKVLEMFCDRGDLNAKGSFSVVLLYLRVRMHGSKVSRTLFFYKNKESFLNFVARAIFW